MDNNMIGNGNTHKQGIQREDLQSRTDGVRNPKAHIISHFDGSDENLEPFVVDRVDHMEKVKSEAGDKLDMTAQLYRSGTSASKKILKGQAISTVVLGIPAALPVAYGTMGFMVGGPLGAVAGTALGTAMGTIGTASMAKLGFFRKMMDNNKSGILHKMVTSEPNWKGSRVYDIKPDQSSAIDTQPRLIDEKADKKPDIDKLTSYFSENLKKHPSARNMIYIHGHGSGYREAASLQSKELAKSLEDAAGESGEKPDVLVLDFCLMGNIEAMAELKDSAKVAVVSEDIMPVHPYPILDATAEASQKDGTPQDIGREIIKTADETSLQSEKPESLKDKMIKNLVGFNGKGHYTLAAVDLEQMPFLLHSMDNLGSSMNNEIKNGNLEELQRVNKENNAYTISEGNIFGDFGNFIDALSEADVSDETKTAARQTRESLDDVIIASSFDEDHSNATGLSFQNKKTWEPSPPDSLSGKIEKVMERIPGFNSGRDLQTYQETQLPDSWKNAMNTIWTGETEQ
jgi:hypothetical protein